MYEGAGGAVELAVPPIARMLLHADGSTTRLLEALLGQRVSLEVVEQQATLAATLAAEVRAALGCGAADEVVYRRSRLCAADGTVVSSNEVIVVCREPEIARLLTDPVIPIGPALAAASRHLGRVLLATGWDIWPLSEADQCVYKQYLLLDSASVPVAHIRERFNPVFVPVA
ncbi:hypothetical protein [Nocardia sp. NPDC051832]|uniref:chorismate--pyruvate lyase family protein n=1 Tax=Nocardia sp. NPDC051832 TaxID=3155673 RepID=UPI003421E140